MICLGKSLSGGFMPISAVLANNEIMDQIKPG
jgi:ornithine--oxo-acid transaminase